MPHETKMLVSLASSYASGCLYCQSHMANLSSIYKGVRREDCRAVELRGKRVIHPGRARRRPAGAESREATEQATQADFDALKEHFDDGQIVEIVASIALFGYLNRWNDTMATELDRWRWKWPRTIGPVGWEPGKHG